MKTKYPVYIISKGRSKNILTNKSLDRLELEYFVVVEPQEFEEYSKVVDPKKIIVTPFSNLDQGSIPVRNFVWEHSIKYGHERHWVLDDNIEDFNRLNRNLKPSCRTGSIFIAAEDFVDRYENIAIAGFNYYSFCKATDKVPPFYLNTRIYSCILIDNNIPYRWRGRYNEDTDLSIRVLKDGYCTLLFNAFLCGKVTTMRMKGGNTDHVYTDGDNRLKFAESLANQHPDVVRVTKKFGRYHHHVNYKPFKSNRLIKKDDSFKYFGIDNYGMVLVDKTDWKVVEDYNKYYMYKH
jgi:hypothetical protein